MGEDTDVTAEAHRHSLAESGSEAGALLLYRAWRGLGTRNPAFKVLGGRFRRGDRGAERDSSPLHKSEDIPGAGVTVLDGLNAGHDCAAHAFRCRRVSCDRASAAGGRLYQDF